MVNPLHRRIRSARGGPLVEMAIVLPILLLLIAGIVDFAVMFHRLLVLTNAAREGARIAVLPGYTQADVQNRVTQYVQAGTGDSGAAPVATLTPVTIDPPGATPPFPAAQVNVTMTHNYWVLGPASGLFGGQSFSSITLGASATMRIE